MKSLFRPEAVDHSTRRLAGEVLLAAPLSAKFVGLTLAGIVLAAAAFAGLATYACTANLSGWLLPDQGLIRAAAPAGGYIQKLFVKEGDAVVKGQRLAEIALAAETEGGNAGETHARGLQQEMEALKARNAAAIARLNAETGQTRVRIANLGGELQQAQAQVALQERRLKLAQTQSRAAEELAARGTLSARDLEQRQSAALSIDLELAGLRRQVASIQREIADGNSRLTTIPIEIQAAQADLLSAEAGLKERISDAEARHAVFVLAPMGGRIAVLPVASGQPVAAGATLAVMTPEGGRLEAELLAPSRAIGFIQEGQDVQLQLHAFPYQRFGTLPGKVKTVSGTVLGPSDISIPGLTFHEPVFRVRVSLAAEEIVAYGRHQSLQPGMLLAAGIVLDRQSLLRWLFDPLYAVSRKS